MNILYLNHICWEWILQRPQILALLLQEDFECTVLNKKFIMGKHLAQNNVKPFKSRVVYLLPKSEKFQTIEKFN